MRLDESETVTVALKINVEQRKEKVKEEMIYSDKTNTEVY